jgi:hypothetical protein
VAVAEEVEEVEEGMAVEDQNCVDSRRTAPGKTESTAGHCVVGLV